LPCLSCYLYYLFPSPPYKFRYLIFSYRISHEFYQHIFVLPANPKSVYNTSV
jgi:hypothetical protein